MKFASLTAIGHNIADSLASGASLLLGYYGLDVYGEASSSPEGYMTVDFLTGATEGARPSKELAEAIAFSRNALGDLCQRHDVPVSAFNSLKARFSVDRVYGGHFVVTVEDQHGRTSVDQYVGSPGKRVRSSR